MQVTIVVCNGHSKIQSASVSKRIVAARNMMNKEIGTLERSNHLARLEGREPAAHPPARTTVTGSRMGSVSWTSPSGKGKPSLRKLSR